MLIKAYRICHRTVSAFISKACGHALPCQMGLLQAAAANAVPAARMMSLQMLWLLPESSCRASGPAGGCNRSAGVAFHLGDAATWSCAADNVEKANLCFSGYQAGSRDMQNAVGMLRGRIFATQAIASTGTGEPSLKIAGPVQVSLHSTLQQMLE